MRPTIEHAWYPHITIGTSLVQGGDGKDGEDGEAGPQGNQVTRPRLPFSRQLGTPHSFLPTHREEQGHRGLLEQQVLRDKR